MDLLVDLVFGLLKGVGGFIAVLVGVAIFVYPQVMAYQKLRGITGLGRKTFISIVLLFLSVTFLLLALNVDWSAAPEPDLGIVGRIFESWELILMWLIIMSALSVICIGKDGPSSNKKGSLGLSNSIGQSMGEEVAGKSSKSRDTSFDISDLFN